MLGWRITLSLDDDIAALRRGLRQMAAPDRPGADYRTPSVELGPCLVGRIDDVAAALALGEGEFVK
jgi:hypothetical protein